MNLKSTLTAGVILALAAILATSATGCSVFTPRPTQLMSDTNAAIKAARNVQADTFAPELFRQANEWYLKAIQEYKFKNFKLALDYATKARLFAEQAEFQAIRNGGKHADPLPPEESAPSAYPPYEYPSPTPTPLERIEAEEAEQRLKDSEPPAAPPTP